MEIANIISLLEQMVDAHEELLATALSKKQTIIAGELNELTKFMMTENRLIKRIAQLETDRGMESTRFMATKGVYSRVPVTQKQLLSVVFDVEERMKLQQLHEQLGKVVNELSRVNEANQLLIKQSIEFVQFSLDVILMPEDESYTYKNPMTDSRYDSLGYGRHQSRK
ncbi:flagellar protein FlgN [Paenibacillus kobensis]|uniref:flagellar protein FlgN n=1 Tax=Paenibacillus kobensis TaxID=59841 RepID=UPI000FDA0C08|nr:flagellar protein FlgN [Paenibacillus kobensis]